MRAEELLDAGQIVQVVELAKMFHEENRPELPFSAEKVAKSLHDCLVDYQRVYVNCFVLLDDADYVQGFLVGHCAPFYYNDLCEARQELVYIHPSARTLNNFVKLLKAFEDWGRLNGAVEFVTGVSVHEPKKAERISRLLTRMNYPRVGYYHMKGLLS